ncbi:MAG: hypothetical protein ABI776_13305 [Nocardioidaceae bacterium]
MTDSPNGSPPPEQTPRRSSGPAPTWPPLVWPVEPIEYALSASEQRRRPVPGSTDDAFCAEVGRRLLLAQFEFSRWILRRVEKVSFSSDRRMARRSSIELRVRDDAPLLVPGPGGSGSGGCWLVPLSVMRRRTLVGLDLRDETGASLSMLGLRFTQKLDESMLRAAAMLGTNRDDRPLPPGVESYVRRVISGPYAEVKQAKQDYHDWQVAKASGQAALDALPRAIGTLGPYFDNVLFAAVLERMWHNFTLYVLLPADDHRHRVVHLAFEEQVTWRFQEPHLAPPDYRRDSNGGRDVLAYQPLRSWVNLKDARPELFGLKTTRIRLLTPSAENCASYHFEFTAPTGLSISGAALLAGRPNDQPARSAGAPSWDRVDNPGQSVGLHAVEVPNGSLCRAQVDLRIPSRGWLSTLLVSAVTIAMVMVTVLFHTRLIGADGEWTVGQVTNIVLLLVTVTAGAATYVAQHHSSDVAARMVSGLRILGTAALTIPAMVAVLLVYLRDEPEGRYQVPVASFLGLLTALSVLAALALARAWRFTRGDERRLGHPSPWEMSSIDEHPMPLPGMFRDLFLSSPGPMATVPDDDPVTARSTSFAALVDELGFAERAIGVASAEGWHETYGWNDTRQRTALEMLGRIEQTGPNPTGCHCRHVPSH